jgi:uncharacterized integral membrane protein
MAETSQSAGAKRGLARGPRAAGRARLIAAGIIGGLIVAFAFLNLESVEVNWILGTWQTPLIVVILLTLAVGILVGVFLARRILTPKTQPAADATGHGK